MNKEYPKLQDSISKIAVLRNGDRYLILKHCAFGIILVPQNSHRFTLPADKYNDKLEHKYNKELDIMKILPITSFSLSVITVDNPNLDVIDLDLGQFPDWERSETEKYEIMIEVSGKPIIIKSKTPIRIVRR